jgi:hypothetical protein
LADAFAACSAIFSAAALAAAFPATAAAVAVVVVVVDCQRVAATAIRRLAVSDSRDATLPTIAADENDGAACAEAATAA